MKCPQCAADNTDGKNFCSDCGSLLTPQLIPLVRFQIAEYLREHLKDQKVVDIETTEAIAERFLKWGKWFLIPTTSLLTILGLTLALFGVRDYSAAHRAAQQAITAADTATKKAQDADTKAVDAVRSIEAATAKMNTQLNAANQLSTKVSGVESKTSTQIAQASKHVEDRVSDLDRKVESANKTIAEQQAKLTSTNELVAAMFSKGQVESFPTTQGNGPNYAVYPFPAAAGAPQKGAIVYMRLKKTPILQTLQIGIRVFVQPKSSYSFHGNVIRFFWGDPAESLKQGDLEVSYVPDPTYTGVTYSALTTKDGHIYADGEILQ